MNLVQDPWLPFRMRDGKELVLPMTAICSPDVLDFALPRADFKGAAYQFAIGLLQTVFAPEDKYSWYELYPRPPSSDELQQALDTAAHAFNVTGDGPLFMQDYDSLTSVESSPVAGLLIEAPGANGIKLNTDHFIKRGLADAMSLEMAALALFTLQINAPAGGVGYRVGLRGGGPLTTLVLPQSDKASLWQKLWLNVINLDEWRYPSPDLASASVFPWLAATQTSQKKGTEIYATDVHPLHMYWAMPRRIRLVVDDSQRDCNISGANSSHTVMEYRTQNYGGNYSGSWAHPLTPYKWNPKKPEEEHLSIKGQPGGITYKTWDVLTFSSHDQGQRCAAVVSHFNALLVEFSELNTDFPRLWAFGYDMDNMKARCWYSVSMPLFSVSPGQQERVLLQIKELQSLASNALWQCRMQIKAAWFDSPSEAKGDTSFIDLAFWQRSETAFFDAVQQLITRIQLEESHLLPEQAKVWLNSLRTICTDLFDEYALSELGSERAMAKRIKARQALIGWLYGGRDIKAFKANHNIPTNKEVA